MKILAISGSLRTHSSNSAILRGLANLSTGWTFDYYNGLATLPHFNPEMDGDTPPGTVIEWREQIRASDLIVFCTPEYAHGIPGSLKNGLDWTVSSGEFVEKPVVVISASPSMDGGNFAHASLSETLKVLSANIIDGGSLSIPFVRKKLNENGQLTDPDTINQLKSVVDAMRFCFEQRIPDIEL